MLALSLLVPVAASADQQVTVGGIANNVSGVSGFPCDTGFASAGALCYFTIVRDAVPGTQMFMSVTVSGGSATSFDLRFYCEGASPFYVQSRALAAGTYNVAAAVPTNCPNVFGSASNTATTGSTNVVISAGSLTYTKFTPGATAAPPAPAPTATPIPAVTPPPLPPAPVGAFAYSSECWHGYKTVGTGYVDCDWIAYGGYDGTHGTEPGPLFADAVTSNPGGLLDGSYYILGEPPAGTADLKTRMAIPAGMTSVELSMGWNWGSAPITDDATGNVVLDLEFYANNTPVVNELGDAIRQVVVTGVAHKLPVSFTTGQIQIPAGTTSLRWFTGCLNGTICSGFYGDYASTDKPIRLDIVSLTWSSVDAGTPAEPLPGCNAVTLPGHTNTCNPDFVIDPNTLLPVCGALSGDCAKPFLAPVPVPVCNPATDKLDAIGWLAYIGCLISTLPAVITNVAILAVNVIIDLLVPSKVDDLLGLIRAQMETRAVFAWVPAVSDAYESAWLSEGVSPSTIGTVTFKGHDIELGVMLDDAMTHVAPFRTMFFGVILLGVVLKVRRRLLTALNGGSIGEEVAA